jgi:xanthine/uracil permease
VKGAQFVSGHFAVMIGISLLEKRGMTLVLGLKLGPSDCPIAVRIQSTEHPAHHRVTRSMAMAMPTRAVVIHGYSRPRRVRGAVGVGFITVFGATFSTTFSTPFSTNVGRVRAGPRCHQQSTRNHKDHRPTHRQTLWNVGR